MQVIINTSFGDGYSYTFLILHILNLFGLLVLNDQVEVRIKAQGVESFFDDTFCYCGGGVI